MTSTKTRQWLSAIFIAAWLVLLVAIACVHWQFAPLSAGLLLASVAALVLLVYGVLLLPVVCFRLLLRKPVSGAAIGKCVFGLLPVSVLFASVGVSGLRAPAIHDISTDTLNPPQFLLAASARDAGDHAVDYEGEVIAKLQQQAYPDIAPLQLVVPPDEAMTAAVDTAMEMGWQMLGVRGGERTFEAVATSLIFGFEDDVVVRVTATGQGGSRVDVRSASRVGLGDLGANARRISAFNRALAEKFMK